MSTNSTSEPRELVETPDLNGAYPRLDEAGIAALAPLGRRRRVQPEEILFREGDRECEFFVVLAGMVASVEGYGTAEESVISVHGRGRFLGELSLLTGEGSYYTAVAAEEGEVLAVPVGRLRELVACDQGHRRPHPAGLPDPPVDPDRARGRAPDHRLPVTPRTRAGSGTSRPATGLPYRWLDLDGDPAAEALLARFGMAPQDTPIVILHGRMLRNPGNAELAAAAGLPAPTASPARCDLLVVGSGPGGMSAAVYGASEGLRTMVLECTATGGQAGTSSRIENYTRLPVRHIRGRTGRTGHAAGPQVRRRVRGASGGNVDRGGRRPVPGPADRRVPGDGHVGGHRHRGQVPQAGRAAAGPLSRRRASTTRPRRRRRCCAPATRWQSSAAAIRPGRRRSSCPGTRPRSPSSRASTT